VTGQTAGFLDLQASLVDHLPLVLAIVAVAHASPPASSHARLAPRIIASLSVRRSRYPAASTTTVESAGIAIRANVERCSQLVAASTTMPAAVIAAAR